MSLKQLCYSCKTAIKLSGAYTVEDCGAAAHSAKCACGKKAIGTFRVEKKKPNNA